MTRREIVAKGWGDCTTITDYKKNNFRLTVRHLSPEDIRSGLKHKQERTKFKKIDGEITVYPRGYLSKGQKAYMAAMLIDQDHIPPDDRFNDIVGVVLRIPAGNVVYTSTSALSSDKNIFDKKFLEQAEKETNLSPEELLQQTEPGSSNTVIFNCDKEKKSRVKVLALFHKTAPGGITKVEGLRERMEELAGQKGLPLIEIEHNPYEKNKIIANGKKVYWNGAEYNLDHTSRWRFRGLDITGDIGFMSRKKMNALVAHLQEEGLDRHWINYIIARYNEAVSEHEKVSIVSIAKGKDKGKITALVKTHNSGSDKLDEEVFNIIDYGVPQCQDSKRPIW